MPTPHPDQFLIAPGISFKGIDLFPDFAIDEIPTVVG